jgi:hypothetical protein
MKAPSSVVFLETARRAARPTLLTGAVLVTADTPAGLPALILSYTGRLRRNEMAK